ncbi:hypothetical protein [Spirosoma fluminis]
MARHQRAKPVPLADEPEWNLPKLAQITRSVRPFVDRPTPFTYST